MKTTSGCSPRSWLALTAAALAVAAADTLAQPFPQFSNPTRITNPYYPIANNRESITVGVDNGAAFRSEETLLPTTRFITWAGGTTETLVSVFVAYSDGDLVEVAYDYFAQSDDGSVYYFGEDVFNYEDGRVANTDGTWLAGRDGAPPGVIMPAQPAVGQVFHPEDFFPLVFEEDTVVSLRERTRTPQGRIGNGLLIHELLLDGTEEFKVYARGFGQVEGREDGASSRMVLLNRVNAPRRGVPGTLGSIDSRAASITADPSNRQRVRQHAAAIARNWNSYLPKGVRDGAPGALLTAANTELNRLNAAIASRNDDETAEAASHLRAAVVDLAAFYNPRIPTDLARLDVLQREMIIDLEKEDFTSATIEHAKAADAVWARLRPTIVRRSGGADLAQRLDQRFAEQSSALDDADAETAIRTARDVIELVDQVEEDVY